MTSDLTTKRDRAARCATALGRALARPTSPPTEAGVGDAIDRMWINRPGQNRLEAAALAALFFLTVTGFCFAWLTVRWGWMPAALLCLPAAFLATHVIGLSCAGITVAIRATGIRYAGTDSDLTGAIVLIVVTGVCTAAVVSGMFLWPLWAVPWLIAAGLNATAWLVSCLINLHRSL